MKTGRLPLIIFLALVFVVLFLVFKGPGKDQSRQTGNQGPSHIRVAQIAIDPQNSQTLYVATSNAGIFKSLDRGKSWVAVNAGLKTPIVQDLVIAPHDSKLLIAGTFGGGIYRSDNGGASWVEVNDGLTNTTISQVVFHPSDSNIVYAMSFGDGVFKSSDQGRTWTSLSEGAQLIDRRNNLSLTNFFLLPVPADPAILYLGTSDGILKRREGGSEWESASVGLKADPEGLRKVDSLAYDPRTKTLLAGLTYAGLYSSHDMGKTWSSLSHGLELELEKGTVYSVILDSSNPKVIYAASSVKGVLRSGDSGASWEEMNHGLEAREIKTLVQDPNDPQTLYAAALIAGGGMFVSTNGGRNWTRFDKGFPAVETVAQDFSTRIEKKASPMRIAQSPPEAFKKCNRCHGWTEPLLNSKQTPWKVAPSRRDWETTVKRMKMMIRNLSPSEETQIIGFLNAQFGTKKQ